MRVLTFLIFSLCICAVPSLLGQSYMVDQVVGIVGSSSLKLSEVESQYMQHTLQGGEADPNIRCAIFERMLEQKLLANQAAIDSIEVTNADVQRAIDDRMKNLVQTYGSEEKIVELSGRSILQLREDWFPSVKEQILAEQMQSSVIKEVKVSPSDVKSYYAGIPKDSIPMVGEQVEVAQIVLNAPYKEEAIAYTRQELLEYRRRILEGESFKTLAIMYSEEPGAVQSGGDIGFISRAGVDPAFAKAAFALKNPGDVSRVIETKFGLHIIQLIEKRGDQVKVRHIIKKPKIDNEAVVQVMARLDSISDMIRIDSFSFEEGARFISHDEKTRNNGGLLINAATGGTRFELSELGEEDQKVVQSMKMGEISKAFQSLDELGNAVFKILLLKNRIHPHKANLSQDYELLLQMTTAQKRQDRYVLWLRDKIRSTYIRINEPFNKCVFSEPSWLK